MKILIVDDDLINQKLLSAVLADYGDIDVAENGKVAVDMVKSNFVNDVYYDIVFLDIMMPVMNGHEALKAMRKLEEQEGIQLGDGMKIVMVSALSDKKDVLAAFSSGCEHYIVKPVKQEKIDQIMTELTN